MFHIQGAQKHRCNLLAIFCGRAAENEVNDNNVVDEKPSRFPFPDLVSYGRLEVQILRNPSTEEICNALDSWVPNIVYLQGETLRSGEIGSLVWGGHHLPTVEAVCGLFSSVLPTTVYLELPNGEKLAEALHSKGIPYVIYWKHAFSTFAAFHFRHALFYVFQSSPCHTWDAFQLAHATFRLYCVRNNLVLPDDSLKVHGELGPHLIGEHPKIDVPPPEEIPADDEDSSGSLPSIKIYDDEINIRSLVCGEACSLDASILSPLEDGLNALLSIEMRGCKLHNRVSALPQAGQFSHGVVTMRCDISTSSSAHISLLVSGGAQSCFDDQILEAHIKNEVIENNQLVHALPNHEEDRSSLSAPRRSVSIACGAAVFEVCLKIPNWALQVLRQLAQDVSYRSLVALGIAGIQGIAVASFEKDDVDRLSFFYSKQRDEGCSSNLSVSSLPSWLRSPAPSRRPELCQTKYTSQQNGWLSGIGSLKRDVSEETEPVPQNGVRVAASVSRQKVKVAAMRPVPHVRHQKMIPYTETLEVNRYEGGNHVKPHLLHVAPPKLSTGGTSSGSQRKSQSSSYQAKQIISLNPLPLKKHGCGRSPIHVCSEEEFLKDVMHFLTLRGHTRLIPQGGLAEFPEAILNAKRLDLFNLYREVVTRGGFHVGNGINWKGQVFSKMRNHTLTNRMTGVGNTLKRHYETYLIEYELAHDDVDGECCLLCRSSAAGDWVNCGVCGEWAHFGCDRRQGLGAFKDYAKTDGLEYICPHCSVSSFKKKVQKTGN